jgi:TPP-dependent indolepyruvate ferredoxin oxidoreductase alpha subunit
MSLLVVDESKCRQDGFCAGDCPRAIIRLKNKAKYFRLPLCKSPKITWK